MMLAAIGARREMLATVFDPAHRMPAVHRKPAERHFLGEQDALIPEGAADVRRDDANACLIETETFRKTGTVDVWHLRRGVDRQLVEPCIPARDDAATLEWRHALTRGPDFPRYPDRSVEPGGHVGFEEGLQKNVVRPILVHPC